MAKAGAFRERAVFQRLVDGAVDDYGNTYTGWKSIGTRWSDIKERTGREAISGGALADEIMATMRCRSDSLTGTITSADRVVARGKTWAIKNVIQVDAKDTMIEYLLQSGVAT
jgi:SPP1 family predicted phage head-tail adaptor